MVVIIYSETVAQIVHGMNRDMSSYFVAKHGVVALTRSLAVFHLLFLQASQFCSYHQRERGTGVDHLAVCPAFAETQVTVLVASFPVDSQEEKINSNQSDTRWSWSVQGSTGEEGGGHDVSVEINCKRSFTNCKHLYFVDQVFSYCPSRPEYVAQCFIKLVETGHNGDVMIVSLINTLSKKHLSTKNFSR